MEKRKDFTGMDPAIHRLAKTNASAKGLSIREYLANLITADSKKKRRKMWKYLTEILEEILILALSVFLGLAFY